METAILDKRFVPKLMDTDGAVVVIEKEVTLGG